MKKTTPRRGHGPVFWQRRAALRALCLLAVCLLATGCAAPAPDAAPSHSLASSSESAPAADADAPLPLLGAFSTSTLDGQAADESLFEGKKVIMLNFWATFCGPCIREMPALGELAAEYADRDVLIVGIPTDVLDQDGEVDSTLLADALDIVEETGADYPHLLPCPEMWGILQQITGVPTTVFVDAEGCQIGYAYVGAMEKEDWAAILDGLLTEADAA